MWYQEMFNPFCTETKGCFNPTVREEGGSGEGCGRRGCGCVRGVGNELHSPSCHSVTPPAPLGIRSHWDYDDWITLSHHGCEHWGDWLLLTPPQIEGDVFSPSVMVLRSSGHLLSEKSSACFARDILQAASFVLCWPAADTDDLNSKCLIVQASQLWANSAFSHLI